jgi:ribosomal protein S18 acetylase RimI-like enzyme
MASPAVPRFRFASPPDARAIADLHADSWRRHYRGAYSDAFLDGDVAADRRAVWSERLAVEEARRCTIVAEADGVIGFANTYLEEDPTWGALLDNLHVAAVHKRRRIGQHLLALTAEAVVARQETPALYLWVLEQNRDARAFYSACGGERVGRAPVAPPGGVAGRLCGAPMKLRYAWPDARILVDG